LALIASAITVSIIPEMRIPTEFGLLGLCFVSAVAFLANGFKYEAGTSIWIGAILSGMLSGDMEGVSKILMLFFAGVCLWLMWYVTPPRRK
jgi:hypothetical protein